MLNGTRKVLTIDARTLLISGIGRQLGSTLEYLLRDKRFERVFLIADPHKVTKLGFDRFEHVRVIKNTSGLFSPANYFRVLKQIPTETQIYWGGFFASPIPTWVPSVATIHDTFHLSCPKIIDSRVKVFLAKRLYMQSVKRAKHVITISEFSKQEIITHLRASEHNVSVTRMAVEIPKSNHEIGEKNSILFVGNVKPHKNIKALIEAFEMIKSDIKLDLRIVGKKEGFFTSYGKHVSLLDSDRVTFTGSITDQRLSEEYQNAKIFVFPSLYEGFGLPPLEAMANGCPVISSRLASVPEVCGDAALYFNAYKPENLANKIRWLLSDPNRQAQMIDRGRQHVKKFSWRKCADQTADILLRYAN